MDEFVALPCDHGNAALANQVDALLARVGEHWGSDALSESGIQRRTVSDIEAIAVRHHATGQVVGYAQITDIDPPRFLNSEPHDSDQHGSDQHGSAVPRVDRVGELVLDPTTDQRRVLDLLVACVCSPDARQDDREDGRQRAGMRLWLRHADELGDAVVAAHGFSIERTLLQLRCDLPLPEELTQTNDANGPQVRAFCVGQDEESWLASNNRAFADHPEQGGWDSATLAQRTSEPWFDADGFRVVGGSAGDGSPTIDAWCWTKIHNDSQPPMGEIYVIGVDPSAQGRGLGRRLAIDGLSWLASRGLGTGMLYVDADNDAARSLYASLGFAEDHRDRAYVRLPDHDTPPGSVVTDKE